MVLSFSSPAMCANPEYDNYLSQLKEKLGIELTIPAKKVTIPTEAPLFTFTFGDMLEKLPTLPIFEGGPVVALSKHCKVVLMDINSVQKPRPEAYAKHRGYNVPSATAWMLNNCDTPWAMWYINNAGGVITDGAKNLSAEEQTALRTKVASLREEYEQGQENSVLTQTANCDKIFIVKIPHLDKIQINKHIPELSCEGLTSALKSNAVECYGVEFYKHSTIEPLKMLFFIDSKAYIDKCVAKMVDHIRFQKPY